jgi:hypothetical protein
MVKNIIIVILIITSIIFGFFCFKQTNYLPNDTLLVHQMMSNDYLSIIKNDTCRTLSDSLRVTDKDNNTIKIENILNGTKKLIVRYSYLNCNSCVDTVIKYATNFAQKNGNKKISVFADYTNTRDFYLFLRLNKNNLDIFRTAGHVSKIDERNVPYMFVLNEDMTISHLFIPHKEYPHLINWYFEVIEKYFADTNL